MLGVPFFIMHYLIILAIARIIIVMMSEQMNERMNELID